MNLCTVLGISLWCTALDSPQDDNDRVFRRQHVLHDGVGGDSKSQSAYLLCLWQWGCGESSWLMLMLIMDSRNDDGGGGDDGGENFGGDADVMMILAVVMMVMVIVVMMMVDL